MILVDIGANLTHDSFDQDLTQVLARASARGVTRIIVTGTDLAHSAAAIDLAQRFPGQLFATAGLHPHHAAQFDAQLLDALRRLTLQPGVVAVGECGLDYCRDLAPHDAQRRALQEQLALAVEVGKPVFLHLRDAGPDFMAVLRSFHPQLRGVAHCFTGNATELEQCLELGLSIGITGWICDERRGLELRQLVRHIPPDRLMIETDAPYLLPRTLRPPPRSRRNEPAHLEEVLRVVADARGETPAMCAAQTTANAIRFFCLDSVEKSCISN